MSFVIVTEIERDDSNGIAGDEEKIFLLIVKGESEDTIQLFQKFRAFLPIKRKDNFTIRASLEFIFIF